MWKRHQSETDMTSETSRHTPWRPFEEAKAKVHAKAPSSALLIEVPPPPLCTDVALQKRYSDV